MSEQFAVRQTSGSPGWQPKFALLLFILALVSPLLVPFVVATDLPREVKGALAGLLLFGLPMALMLLLVGMIGQPAFAFVKRIADRTPPSPLSA